MNLNKNELQNVLKTLNNKYNNLINLQYVEREGKQYVIETNEAFGSDDYITHQVIEAIDNHLAPQHYLETETTNVYMIGK